MSRVTTAPRDKRRPHADPQHTATVTFDTHQPISVTAELGVGDIRIVASDRTDTIVEVRPSDPAKKADATAAEQTRVEYADGRLLIKAPKGWRQYSLRGGGESIDVRIALPSGSQVRGDTGVGALRSVGRLGECHFKTGLGEIQLDIAGPLQLKTGSGDISVDRAVGQAELTTGTGRVQVGAIDGAGVVRNSNGDTRIGEVSGDLRVNAANGSISVDRAQATVAAKTANGDIRLGEICRGVVVVQTGRGNLDVGIHEGVAAWLDLHTNFGAAHSFLDHAEHPGTGAETVEVRARSSFGDIFIRHTQRSLSNTAADGT
jgi:hypothetical protein